MTHLLPEQIVDVADGCATPAVTAHAAACETCRASIQSLLEAARLAADDEQAEPSPLFWPHLAARIGEAVRREHAPAAAWRLWLGRLAPIGAVAALVIAVGAGARFWTTAPVGPAAVPDAPAAASMQGTGTLSMESDPADDPSWLLVSDLSGELIVGEAEAFGALPLPGGVEGALTQLDAAERMELARILREAIAARTPITPRRPGA